MTTQLTRGDIFLRIQKVLCDALGVEADEVAWETTLVGDLGAEDIKVGCSSMDLRDMAFRLDRAFGIDVSMNDLFPDDILGDSRHVMDGLLIPAGIEVLQERMPFKDLSAFEAKPAVDAFASLLTAGDLCKYVEFRLGVAD